MRLSVLGLVGETGQPSIEGALSKARTAKGVGMKRLLCWLLGHQPQYEARIAENVMRFSCLRCGQRFLSVDDKTIPWSDKAEQAFSQAIQEEVK